MSNKSANAFRTISEVATRLGVPKHVLRFWEGKFPQIKPMKRGGGRRYYRPEDIALLHGIRALLHSDGYTIKGVQKILREQGVNYVKDHGKSYSVSGGEAPDGGQSHADMPAPARRTVKRRTKRSSKADGAASDGELTGRKTEKSSPVAVAPHKAVLGANEVKHLSKGQRDALSAVISQLEDCRAALLGKETLLKPVTTVRASAPEQSRKQA